MKSLVAIAFLLVVIALPSIYTNPTKNNKQKSDATSIADIEEDVINSGKKLVNIMKSVEKVLLDPMKNSLDVLDAEIKQIDTHIKGITPEERKQVEQALLDTYNIQTDLYSIKQTLAILAKSTMSRSKRLIKIYGSLKEGEDVHRKIKYSVKKMIQLLKRSKDVLEQSLKEYKEITKKINSVKSDLYAFAAVVKKLNGDERWKIKKKKKNADIEQLKLDFLLYGAPCVGLFVIVSCPVYYGVTETGNNPILESKIKDIEDKYKTYKASVNALQDKATKTAERTKKLSKKVGDNLKYVKKEEEIIKEWNEKVIEMAEDYTSVEDVEFHIEIETKENAIQMLCDLSRICKKYIEHKHKDVQDFGIVSPNLPPACS